MSQPISVQDTAEAEKSCAFLSFPVRFSVSFHARGRPFFRVLGVVFGLRAD